MKPPKWAKSPGWGYHHRNNYSDTEVVWYGPGGDVIYQYGKDEYREAATRTAPHRWRSRAYAAGWFAAGGVVTALAAYFRGW